MEKPDINIDHLNGCYPSLKKTILKFNKPIHEITLKDLEQLKRFGMKRKLQFFALKDRGIKIHQSIEDRFEWRNK